MIIPETKESKEVFIIQGWQWIFFIIGLLTGIVNITFWIYQIILYLMYNYGEKFISNSFNKRTYYWGIFTSIVLFVSLLIILILF